MCVFTCQCVAPKVHLMLSWSLPLLAHQSILTLKLQSWDVNDLNNFFFSLGLFAGGFLGLLILF